MDRVLLFINFGKPVRRYGNVVGSGGPNKFYIEENGRQAVKNTDPPGPGAGAPKSTTRTEGLSEQEWFRGA